MCVCTMQTTIEFYINMEEREIAKDEGYIYKNPFDEGLKNNYRRVFGDYSWYTALLPSVRHPIEPLYPFILKNELKNHNNNNV